MHRRSKRTPESMLQKYAAIRAVDARGLAHCFEVRIVNPDALGEDKIKALMGAARDSDIDTVKLLYDGVDACVEINQCVGCTMTRPSWLRRAVRNRYHHEQAS